MSDERPIDEVPMDELEARAIGEVLEALERGALAVSDRARPFLEVLAALPAGLDPVEPSAAVKDAVMTAARSPTARASGTGRGLPSWALRVAAVLAVALLGIAGLQSSRIASQQRRIETQADEIARLQDELAAAVATTGDRPPEWMTASGTELCALSPRPAVETASVATGERAARDSKGWLFVRRDHQHWFVAVEGLTEPPPDHVYELWFVVEGDLVSAGTFRPDAAGRATLTSETMPNPVTGIAITLEPDNGDGVPSEEMVLYGDEVMLVL